MKPSRVKYTLLCIALALIAAAIIVYPERYVHKCLEGFALWAECVLPSLFPFMVIALLFVKSGLAEKASLPLKKAARAVNLPANGAACFIISICSGYPAGSRILCEFYESGTISASDCKKLAPLCSTSGPLFIIGSVGFGMFSDKTVGLKILVAHIVSVVAVSLVYSLFSERRDERPSQKLPGTQNLIYDCFYGAVISVAVAGGFIAFFNVLVSIARDFKLFYPVCAVLSPLLGENTAEAVCAGLVEATNGCRMLSAAGSAAAVPLAGFIITFGGISILLQQLAYLVKTGVKPIPFALMKLVQAAICALILLMFQ